MSECVTSNPKFTARYTLGLFLVSNWLYNTLVVGDDGIADFSKISTKVFNDKMFYVGAYKQVSELVADITDQRIVDSMMESRTFLLDRQKLKEVQKLDDTKMAELAEAGMSVYSMLLTKKLAEQTVFDEDIIPDSYTCIDGSDKKAVDITVPLNLVFSIDSDTLDNISNLLEMSNSSIVKETIDKLMLDDKMACFKTTFDFISKIESLI